MTGFKCLIEGEDVLDFIGAKQSHVKISWYKRGGDFEPIQFYLDDDDNLQRFIYAHSRGLVSTAFRIPDSKIEISS